MKHRNDSTGRKQARSQPPAQDTPPHSVEAEQGVISSIMASPCDAIAECVAIGVQSHWFYVPAHRTIYGELRDVWDSGTGIDLITFTQHLRDKGLLTSVGGAAAVTDLQLYGGKSSTLAPMAFGWPTNRHLATVATLRF
jgi:replicative DNA helicase